MNREAIDTWIDEHAIPLDPETYEAATDDTLGELDKRLAEARVVFLGETNHFVTEKTDFRLWWLRRLARAGPPGRRIVLVEELSRSDGVDVRAYLASGDDSVLMRAATFGDRRHERPDRDDRPTGVFSASFDTYPAKPLAAEQKRFYSGVRELDTDLIYVSVDIDAPGTGYDDLARHHSASGISDAFWQRLERVTDESMRDEIRRLEDALALLPDAGEEPVRDVRDDLEAMIASLRYTVLAYPAPDYESLRPAMALRENIMKRHVERLLAGRADDDVVVFMAHAFHLAKDDSGIEGQGVGPGGGIASSLGHHLTHELGIDAFSAWMVYGGGRDSQPMPDLPNVASYPSRTLNARLARAGVPLVVQTTHAPTGEMPIGHMYNLVVDVRLIDEADAVWFVPAVSPLPSG